MSATENAERVSAQNPWPGLSAYEEADRGFFQGRDEESAELFRLVKRETLTTVYGQSGLGKTSLLQAGLFPRFRESDFLPVYVRLEHDESAPPLAAQALAAVAEECRKNNVEAVAPLPGDTLWEYFHRPSADFWNARNRLITPALIFDQFEEIFTLGRANPARRERGQQFLVELADLVEVRVPRSVAEKIALGMTENFNFERPGCKVLLSLREDFLPDLETLRPLMRSLIHNRQRIERMKGPNALDVILKPGADVVSPEVANAIIRFVSAPRDGESGDLEHAEVEPSLLSLVCRELNNRRIKLGLPQITTDLLAGSHREIVAEFYERSLEGQPPSARRFIEDRLLTRSGFRDSVALEEAEQSGLPRETIDLLIKRRLLRMDERLGVHRVELTHDVLLAPIKASRDARREEDELVRLRQREREQARKTRRLMLIGACLILAIVAMAGLTWYSVAQSRVARAAEKTAELALRQQKVMLFEATVRNAKADEEKGESAKLIKALEPLLADSELKEHVQFREAGEFVKRANDGYTRLNAFADEVRRRLPVVTLDLGNGINMEMVLIPAGSFSMGSGEKDGAEQPDADHQKDEKLHKVTLTQPFYMCKYHVTQEQFMAVMGHNPSYFKGRPKHPVEQVTWFFAEAFCEKLCKQSGMANVRLRLPTEAQWEYACRAGTKTRFYFGDNEKELGNYAWYKVNAGIDTPGYGSHPVAALNKPNPFGLYEMHGNVHDWCLDWYDSKYYESPENGSPAMNPQGPEHGEILKATSGPERVLRGGSWYHPYMNCRSAYRFHNAPDTRYSSIGFRPVWVLP